MLVDAHWLHEKKADPNLRIFDVTGVFSASYSNVGKLESYDRAHIPGAAYLGIADPRGPLADQDAPLEWTWPGPEQFERAMRELGVERESHVIVYSNRLSEHDLGIMWATRAWWIFDAYGVKISILNGGLKAWQAAGFAVSSETTVYPRSEFSLAAQHAQKPGIVVLPEVLAIVSGERRGLLMDTLPPAVYAGDEALAFTSRRGHVRGAINLHYDTLFADHRDSFRPTEELKALFGAKQVDGTSEVVTYCAGGIGATVNAVALRLAGVENVRIYDGSLREWTSDPSLPMETRDEA